MQETYDSLPELGGETAVPTEANQTLQKIDQTGQSPYRSAQFLNDGRGGGQILPQGVQYTEHDMYPLSSLVSRGVERIVTGSDGSAWYTPDHYQSFIKMR